jgi:hypothetical protein
LLYIAHGGIAAARGPMGIRAALRLRYRGVVDVISLGPYKADNEAQHQPYQPYEVSVLIHDL